MFYHRNNLKEIAYDAMIQKFGTKVCDIKVGKKYMLINNTELNYILLGKCLTNYLEIGHPIDPIFARTLKFEFNMNNPLLKTIFYGQHNICVKINIIEDDEPKENKESDEFIMPQNPPNNNKLIL
jgi:hypothetical protein